MQGLEAVKVPKKNLSIILEKFVADKNGNLINNTCVSVFEEQQEKYAIRSERASKGGIAKKKKVLEAQSKQTASVLTPCSDGAELRVLSKDNTEKREMPSAEFEKIIDENEDDYLWIEEISKRFGFTDAYEANQQINFAYRKFIRDNYFQKGIPIYFNDHKHVRNSAVSWYEVIKKRQQSEAKRKQVW